MQVEQNYAGCEQPQGEINYSKLDLVVAGYQMWNNLSFPVGLKLHCFQNSIF